MSTDAPSETERAAVEALADKAERQSWRLEQADLDPLVAAHGAMAAYRLGLHLAIRRLAEENTP